MTQLAVAGNGPLPPPRMTRAERLRRQSKESAVNNGPQTAVIANGSSSPGKRFAFRRYNSQLERFFIPSRQRTVHSERLISRNWHRCASSSQRSRRPRPASIAGTGVSADNSASRLGINGERPKSTIDKEGASKPPLPKVHAAPRKSVPSKPETPKRTITEKVSRPNSVKASPKLTPKATPLQSPGDGSTKLDTTISKQAVEVTNTTIVKTETINGKTEVSVEEEQTVVTTTPSGEVLTETTSNVQNQELIAPVSAPADGQNAIAANQEDAAKVVGESVKTNEEVKIAEVEKPAEAVQQANAVVEENNTIPVQQVKPDVAKTEEVKSADAPAPVENGDSVDMTGK
ncbi:proteoglycan 4-like [Ctenocephalides felis]|uniref:proteoglycan 4-like n=1 Tax=Ctenocephalides felis TaxID=7515 RepID=UPI000E6E19B1|nr:proteoglycan 4-like [Ctenocephalides felis]